MKIKAVIIDFDRTITTADMSDLLAGLVGKEAESAELDRKFKSGELTGLAGLIQRVNFLNGVSVSRLESLVESNDYLRPGAVELFQYFQKHSIVSIIASGSTIPFLQIYQRKLGADYLVGSNPKMNGGVFAGVTLDDYSGLDFKVRDSRVILDNLGIQPSEVAAIGDSRADVGIFEFAELSIAIDPPADIEPLVDYVIHDDLDSVIPILDGASL